MSKSGEPLPHCSFCGISIDKARRMIQSQLAGQKVARICDACIRSLKAKLEAERK